MRWKSRGNTSVLYKKKGLKNSSKDNEGQHDTNVPRQDDGAELTADSCGNAKPHQALVILLIQHVLRYI